ncbi:HalOD1 output domain-containing protein [Natrialba swarupiae]|uniref:Halobacterial output domain-containing protein n=1 Tax=Natrialba swarupiae TaxID=2448032 RepID=A0A5D5ANG6_9EURY|nr:HalOD1 output domain-containing protein [Natrialba swarupiae]MCW8173364.1 hypothetical protein [Natrialba swarupiae]TYT61272.1 hypothetical protein FYC77_14560 [Natrialba swarupiae]
MGDSAFARSKPSLRVVEQVADAEDVTPGSLEPPLNDVVDPTALDRLFEPTTAAGSTRRGRVTFSYCGYDVTVTSDGSVGVT